jgi:hypothetical protein
LSGGWSDKPDIWRQRHRHTNESVFHQIREVARVVSIYAKVVSVDGTKERIVGGRVVLQRRHQRFEPGVGRGRRELEVLRWHVTVCASSAVAADLVEIAIVERRATSRHRVARWLVAIESRPAVLVLPEPFVRE